MKLTKILSLAVFATLTFATPAFAAVQGSVALSVETADGTKTRVHSAAVQDVAWSGDDGTPQTKKGTVRLTLKHGVIDASVLEHWHADRTPIPSLDLKVASGGTGTAYLKYKLDRCWVKSWSTSGDADVVEIGYVALERED